MKKNPFIFIHIPKCAGTTLHKIINKNYEKNELYTIGMDPHVPIKNSIENFKNFPIEKRNKIKCLKGHMPFGLHLYLSNNPRYITILRDPVRRVVSHYNYAKNYKYHYLYETINENKLTLYDYVYNDITPEINNGQVRLLAGIKSQDTVYGNEDCDESTLKRGLINIEKHFIACGILSDFDEFLVAISEYFKWKNIYYFKRNVKSNYLEIENIDSKTLSLIERKNKLDLILYDKIRKGNKYNFQVKNLGARVVKFKKINKIHKMTYGNLYKYVKMIYQKISNN